MNFLAWLLIAFFKTIKLGILRSGVMEFLHLISILGKEKYHILYLSVWPVSKMEQLIKSSVGILPVVYFVSSK